MTMRLAQYLNQNHRPISLGLIAASAFTSALSGDQFFIHLNAIMCLASIVDLFIRSNPRLLRVIQIKAKLLRKHLHPDYPPPKLLPKLSSFARIIDSTKALPPVAYHDYSNTAKLDNLKKALDNKTGVLTLPPPIPSPAPPINQEAVANYIKTINDNSIQDFILRLVRQDKFCHIYRYNDFLARLKGCMSEVQQYIVEHKLQDTYTILANDQGSSHQWVASHAMQYLQFIPDRITTRFNWQNDFKALKLGSIHHPNGVTLFIFDDWSISGRQLCSGIQMIIEHYIEQKCQYPLRIIATPTLMTCYAFNQASHLISRIHQLPQSQNIELRLFTSKLIPSFADIDIPSEDWPKLHKLCNGDREFNIDFYRKTIFAYSDWKTPDAVSAPRQLMDGLPPPGKLDLYRGIHTNKIPDDLKYPATRIVPEVIPPYRIP